MPASCDGVTAAEIVNETPEKELADLIYKYGAVRTASRAKLPPKLLHIGRTKKFQPPRNWRKSSIRSSTKHRTALTLPTRTFQALRIAVDNELGELENGLRGAVDLAVWAGESLLSAFIRWKTESSKPFLRKTPAKMFTFHAICRTTIFNKTTAFWPPAPKRLPLLRTRRRLTAAPGRPNCAMLSKGNVTRKELHHE